LALPLQADEILEATTSGFALSAGICLANQRETAYNLMYKPL